MEIDNAADSPSTRALSLSLSTTFVVFAAQCVTTSILFFLFPSQSLADIVTVAIIPEENRQYVMKRNASKCCRCISMVSCVVADDNFRSLMQLIAALHRQYLIPIFPFFAFVRPFNQPAIFPCRSCIHLRPTHIEFVDSLNAYADVCMCVCVCVWHIFKRSLHPLFSIKHTIDLISGHLNAFYRTEIDIDIEDESGEMCIRSALTRFFPPTFHVKNEMMARLVVVCFTSKSNIAMAG